MAKKKAAKKKSTSEAAAETNIQATPATPKRGYKNCPKCAASVPVRSKQCPVCQTEFTPSAKKNADKPAKGKPGRKPKQAAQASANGSSPSRSSETAVMEFALRAGGIQNAIAALTELEKRLG